MDALTRAAVYCRVSTDTADQANSFAAQQRYFREFIAGRREWELYAVYADEGITGTSTENRTQFLRMIEDARAGKFSWIITKEVSRFSRNILDTIAYTRLLRQMGVYVLFASDGISTADADAELRLSIMASIAQEESRRISARVKWGQTRRMEQGVVFGHSLLGYDVQGGCITVNREGAEIVRRIFRQYGSEGKSLSAIAEELRAEETRTGRNHGTWSASRIGKILRNEKYTGDLVQKKTITPDYLTHKKRYNHGEERQVCIRNHHEPIVERELWDAVQNRLREHRRGAGSTACGTSYPFSGKIRCGECGRAFIARSRMNPDGTRRRIWRCASAASDGRRHSDAAGTIRGCDVGKLLSEEAAADMMRQMLRALPTERDALAAEIAARAAEAIRAEKGGKERADSLQREIQQCIRKKERLLDSFLAGDITREEMLCLKQRLDADIAARREAIETVGREQEGDEEAMRAYLGEILAGERDCEAVTRILLRRITVFRDAHAEAELGQYPYCFRFEL